MQTELSINDIWDAMEYMDVAASWSVAAEENARAKAKRDADRRRR